MDNLKHKPIVIIGGGTVGLFLAHELMERGEKVLLIESGGDNFHFFNSNEFYVAGYPHNGASIGRVKGVGGTSNLWGGQLTEFIQKDIDAKNSYQQPTWPITWTELSSYYTSVYQKVGLQKEFKSHEKFDISDHNEELEISYTRWLKQPNFKQHFAEELENSSHVKVYKKTAVTNLFFENGKCSVIEINNNGNVDSITDFSRVVLALGTIEISRLLLIAAKSTNTPFSNNKWIGKYFQDHINVRVGQISRLSKSFFAKFSNFFVNGEKLQPKLRMNKDRNEEEYLGISGIFSFDSNVSNHIDNFKQFTKAILSRSHQRANFWEIIKMVPKLFIAFPQICLIIYHYLKNNRVYVPFTSKVTLNLQTQQISIASSQITLSDHEFDPLGMPKAIINWQIDGREFNKIKEFCFVVKNFLASNNLGDLQFEKWFEQECLDNQGNWLKYISDVYHQAGGAIMSDSDANGVVDKNLKVHNTDNVFICGAAVMPTSSYANTTLTALALTMRLADYVTQE